MTAGTQEQVLAKLRRLQAQTERGTVEVDQQASLEIWLATWLRTIVAARLDAGRLRASTVASYRGHVDQHIVPAIGKVRLAKLTPQHVRQLHADLRDKGLAPATVGRVHATLRKALSDAEADELVIRNVAKVVPAPSAARPEVRPLTLAQARHLLEVVRGNRLEAAYVLMLAVGLRLGEVLGLR